MDGNPIQRLAYFNGERLEAADLQLEQHYHIAVRRILTAGLFTPGVVSGFDVQGTAGATQVTVKAGVALDPCGREIIQVDDQTLTVPNTPPTSLGGYFLTVTYAETQIPGENGWCPSPPPDAAARTQEGGTLAWTETLPAPANCSASSPSDCAIVLAFVAITNCTVASIVLTPRQYAAPAHTSQTQAFALEGEKDIDANNPKRVFFQIVGGPPQSMTLLLWGDLFSTLYYTELGGHKHTLNKDGSGSVNLDWDHDHDLNSHKHPIDLTTVNLSGGAAATDPAGDHIHNANVSSTNWQLEVLPVAGKTNYHLRGNQKLGVTGGSGGDGSTFISSPVLTNAPEPSNSGADPPDNLTPNHVHGLSTVVLTATAGGTTANTEGPTPTSTGFAGSATDTRAITGSTDLTGVAAPQARPGSAYTYINSLQVALDSVDVTTAVLGQLPSMTTLGDGNSPFATGPVDLLAIAAGQEISLGPGTHYLDLTVATGNGGKVLYNLYVA